MWAQTLSTDTAQALDQSGAFLFVLVKLPNPAPCRVKDYSLISTLSFVNFIYRLFFH